MNQIKQEPWDGDGGSEFQDFQWNNLGQLPQSPYFNPEILNSQFKAETEEDNAYQTSNGPPPTVIKEPKKRGRPKKVKDESAEADIKSGEKKVKQESATDNLAVAKKRRDRFNGMPEEEVLQRLLPDHIAPELDILIIGINPGLFAAYVGHHYAGPGNHFWRCMYLAGLIPEPMSAYDDYKLISLGIGFTNICARTTRGSADLKKQEIRDGADILRKKLAMYKPKIAVFNGKGIYEVFSGNKNFNIGKQPDKVEGTDTVLFVMPSSSARCAQLPRAVDKVPYYLALKKLRDFLRGELPTLDESEVVFPPVDQKTKTDVKEEPTDDDEDSRLSYGDSSNSREMTLEQIQMQSEYLEALVASAEGKDIPMEKWGGRRQKCSRLNRGDNSLDTETSGSGDESSQPYIPQIHHLTPRVVSQSSKLSQALASSVQNGPSQEIAYDGLEVVTVNGPTAQRVDFDAGSIDPYHCQETSSPQYLSLGDIPSKKSSSSKSPFTSSKSPNFPHLSSAPMQLSSPCIGQPQVVHGRGSCPSHPRVSAKNGSSFPHYHSRATLSNGKETKSPTYINI